MFPSKVLLSLAFIYFAAVNASPLSRSIRKATLNFSTRINGTGTLNVIEQDRARAQTFKNANHDRGKRGTSFSVTNSGMVYTAQVGVGNPATDYKLLIDTGSSNTWVGADKPYIKSSTSKDTGNSISVSYGVGSFSGEEYIDTLMLAHGLVIESQPIGVANSVSGISDVDGILGLGPADLTSGTVSNANPVPTISDNLLSQGIISEEVLGIYFVPVSESHSDGILTFGGYDNSVITSSVKYTSLTTTSPASGFWGIDQSISYSGITILSTTAGIVDTGTTLVLIASDAFKKYESATGASLDSATGLLTISPSNYGGLKMLSFNIGGTSYDLSPNAQTWPRSLNSAIGGSSSSIYLIIGDIDSSSGTGLDFINGYTFLERYYSVFDTTNGRVGFATTAYTDATTN